MATRPAGAVARALELKGMKRETGHHIMLTKQVAGVTHLVTRISHSASVIDDGLGSLMGKQLALQLKEFWQLVDCPLTEQEWEKIVTERCTDGRNPFTGR